MPKLKFTGGKKDASGYKSGSAPLEDDPLGIISYILLILGVIAIPIALCIILSNLIPIVLIPACAIYYLWSKEYIRWE